LVGLLPQRIKIISKELDRQVAASAAFHQLLHTHLNGLREAVDRTGSFFLQALLHRSDQVAFAAFLSFLANE
jgi:hypothetical protein